MKLVSEVEDLVEWRRMSTQKEWLIRFQHGQSDSYLQDLWVWDFSKSSIDN